MDRKKFLKNSLLLTGGLPFLNVSSPVNLKNKTSTADKILNAYYLRAHMYTMVPHQIKEDMKWMAGIGTNVVSIAILEQDLWAAVSNIEVICNAAEKEGMKVWGVPSRWGGLVAGAPKTPSLFSASHPDTWILKKDGTPLYSDISAVVSSIYHPGTLDFFCNEADDFLKKFPFDGLIWDEPKHVGSEDFSAAAIKTLGIASSYQERVKHYADFFSSVNSYLRKKHPEITLSLFNQAMVNDMVINTMASIQELNYYGCDGRPWSTADGGQLESAGKTLLDNGPKFLDAAKANHVKSLLLMENHNLQSVDFPLLKKGIPKVMAMNPDQLIYYYYPRNVDDPEKEMEIISATVKKYH